LIASKTPHFSDDHGQQDHRRPDLMIPAFVTMAIYYGESIKRGDPLEWQRFTAIIIFILAAVSDGLDGYVARRYNQRSRLGVYLDQCGQRFAFERHRHIEYQQLESIRS